MLHNGITHALDAIPYTLSTFWAARLKVERLVSHPAIVDVVVDSRPNHPQGFTSQNPNPNILNPIIFWGMRGFFDADKRPCPLFSQSPYFGILLNFTVHLQSDETYLVCIPNAVLACTGHTAIVQQWREYTCMFLHGRVRATIFWVTGYT